MKLRRLHRQSEAIMTLTAVVAFISGAGLDAPSVLPALVLLAAVALWQPSIQVRRWLDPLWKTGAILLTARAALHVARSPDDIVLPMVDLLLLLLVAEVFRVRDTGNDARVYALTFALLVAAAAYRPGILFAIAFTLYMAAATVSLMIGHLLHSIERRPIQDVPLRPRFLFQSAAFSGVALLTAAIVFLAFPRVTRGWVTRGLPVASNVTGFSDRVSLLDYGGRLVPNPQVVLRIEFPDGRPANTNALHWRGRSFDTFDDGEWRRTRALWASARGSDTSAVTPTVVRQQITAADLGSAKPVFGLHEIKAVRSDDFRFEAERYPSGDYRYTGVDEPVYTVYSNTARPTRVQLDADSGTIVPAVTPYLQRPAASSRLIALADSLSRGRVTVADKVRAVEEYLQPFTYTLDLPRTAREASLDYFIFERRQGHCEYFSTAMAVLLRMMGVPARNVNGFLGGEWNAVGGFLNVTQNQAHSWVEVWYPEYGWIEHDPTPASLSGVAEQQSTWFRPFRMFLDGADYRWNRWVLDYDVRRQLDIFNRVTDAFRAPQQVAGTDGGGNALRWVLLAAAGILAVGVFRRARFTHVGGTGGAEARTYLRLRKAYEKAGLAQASQPPLAFATALDRGDAPGAKHAATVVGFYVRARFGGEILADTEREELRIAAMEARAALRARAR
jgi:transglutaminase-like putative cysteine protease